MAARKKRVLTPEEQLEAALVPESEWPYEVPENWCWIRLLDSFDNATDSKKKIPQKQYKSFGHIAIVDQGESLIGGYTDDSKLQYAGELPVIIFGDHTRRLKYVDFPFAQGADGVKVLLPKPFIDPKFFFYALHSVDIPNLGYRRHFPLFKNFCIPLPSLREQRLIVQRVEHFCAKLDDAEAELREVIDSLEQRQAAILHRAFNGELTKTWRVVNGLGAGLESWQPTTSDELFEYVTSGSRGWAKYYSDTGAVFLRMGNLDHGTIELDLSDIQHVELPDRAEGQRSLVKKDDILISITADVGMIGFVRNIDYEAYINQHVALARPAQPKSAEFIAWYLVSDMGFVQLRQKQRGATKVGLGLDDIRSLTLLMPTESEQELILESINSCMDNEARMVEAAEKAIGSIHKTRQSILNQALHGELGTNDTDEPSSKELLASIFSGNASE